MKILTSEAVFRGHPDKICDQISDAILDACLAQDSKSRVACECLIKDGVIFLAGEITTNAQVDYASVAYDVLRDIGVYGRYKVLEKISKQSNDIALGVDANGAGDQGIVYGYACDETEELMPLPIVLARKIAMKMDELTKPIRQIFGADGKCQVSVAYDDKGKPTAITTIIVSQQTAKGLDRNFYENFIIDECINKIMPKDLMNDETVILINPTGEFSNGGSYADCGLTGRKIMVDTYGGLAHHGGGAFSGKDLTKVDRLGAYYARYLAKIVVASGLAKKCEISIAYAIGKDKPVAINVDTFKTSKYSDDDIKKTLLDHFAFTPKEMKKAMMDEDVRFYDLAKYGHIGINDNLPWEKADKFVMINSLK